MKRDKVDLSVAHMLSDRFIEIPREREFFSDLTNVLLTPGLYFYYDSNKTRTPDFYFPLTNCVSTKFVLKSHYGISLLCFISFT